MRLPVLFLDDGGVMNDNAARGAQWQRLVGEFFSRALGGSPQAWGEANYTMAVAMFEPSAWSRRLNAVRGYADFLERYHLDWLTFMCESVGVPVPEDAEALALAERAERWIIPQVCAALPGAADAIVKLHAEGYRLFTASGARSADLHDYLTGMRVRDAFEGLYGPDLIDTVKNGPEYYERVFADAGVPAEDAMVVDDSPAALGWASEVGATPVLVSEEGKPMSDTLHVRGLRELPDRLCALRASR